MEFYNSIAAGYDELYAEEQRIKLKLIKENLDIKNNDLLLDVGCGSGLSSNFNCEVIGLDPSLELLNQGKKDNNENNYNLNNKILARAESIPFKDNVFDKVISVTSMHNFDDIQAGIQEIKRVGKKDFVFSILKRSAVYKLIEKEINANFNITKIIEDKKDSIFICHNVFK